MPVGKSILMGLVLLGGLLLSGFSLPPQAQAGLQPLPPDYTFGSQVTFKVSVPPEMAVSEAKVFFKSQGDARSQEAVAALAEENQFHATIQLSDQPLRGFAIVTYWFVVKTEDGQQLTSPEASFRYEDNATDRKELVEAPFRIRWYEGDEAFARNVLAEAHQALDQAQKRLGAAPPEQINIYVYANALDLQAALRLGRITWVAGHADPEIGVMLVSLPAGPEQRTTIQKLIPHELSHIMLYQLMGASYANLPAWLNEGLASVAETSPNPDYDRILKRAKEKDAFIPLASLCQSFPMDASGAVLAYAESEWFTRYLIEQFGESGMQALIDGYMNGLSCERGPEMAYGKSLAQLERDWQQTKLGVNAARIALEGSLPWLGLLLVALAAPAGAMLVSLRRRSPKAGAVNAAQPGRMR